MNYPNKLFLVLISFLSSFFYSKSDKEDTLRGNFTYLLRAKLNTLSPNQFTEELFSLQVVSNRAFFTSEQSVKRDSVIQSVSKVAGNGGFIMDARGKTMPKTRFSYTIIQSNENVQYYQWIALSLLSYKQSTINSWKLIDEYKIINTINCKKAEVSFKGRNWIAWYSPEIPLPYGPYKFAGLPGLIIKITDEKGDYDFELVKSSSNSKMKGKLITLNKARYTGAIETTQPKFERALEDANDNVSAILASYGTTIIQGKEIVQQRLKEREFDKKGKNPIELDN